MAGTDTRCGCTGLAGLFVQRDVIKPLERACDDYKLKANLENPTEKDRGSLEAYRNAAARLQTEVEKYYEVLNVLAERGKLKFKVYEPQPREISYEQALDMLEEKDDKKPIISVHCANCMQVVDSID